jgi:transposase
LGLEPIEINSSLVSAQNRRRLYWTNIPNINQPIDKELTLKDRVWTCKCGETHDRDVNASKNIKNFGLRNKPSNANVRHLACA